MGPNFFTYANSELTNDGLICWLIDWCQYPGSELYGVAMDLLALFMGDQTKDLHVTKLTIIQQLQNIDMLFEINDEFLLVIEDKIDSKEHANQLQKYRSIVKDKFSHISEENQYFAYLKIGDQSSYDEVISSGYRIVHREDLLPIFQAHDYVKHPLFQQYCEHLESIQNDVLSYQTLELSQWTDRAWQGFYKNLQTEKKLKGNHWDYVSNTRGGFWGFWWLNTPFPSSTEPEYLTYLQIEQTRISFKIEISDSKRLGKEKSAIRNTVWKTFEKLLSDLEPSPYLPKKTVFQQGTWMSFAEITSFSNPESLQEIIKYAESIMDQLNQLLSIQTKA